MDRAWACPASHHPPEGEVLVEQPGDPGPRTLGSAMHEVAAFYVRGEAVDLEDIAARWGLDKAQKREMPRLYAAIREAWKVIEPMADDWSVEVKMSRNEPFPLKGTADVLGISDGRVVVVDWKSGRKTDSPHEQQVRGYGWMAALDYPASDFEIVALVVWLQDWDIQTYRWTAAELREWMAEFHDRVWSWDGTSYAVGEQCVYCQRGTACPGRSQALASASTAIMATDPALPEGVELGRLWDAIPALEKACKATRERVKEAIEASGGLDLGDGRRLALKERNIRPEIDSEMVPEVLSEWSEGELARCATYSITALRDVAAERAPRGEKIEARKALEETLVKSGAMVRRTCKVTIVEKGGDDGK